MNQLVMIRGDTREFTLTLADEDGAPLDLTDLEVWFSVGGQIAKTLTGGGITSQDPETGVAVIKLDPADTSGFPSRRTSFPYDVQVRLTGGEIKTPIRGALVVLPDVTTDI